MPVPSPPPSCANKTPLAILKSVFGYETFRPLQGEVIDHVLAREDTLAVMPTGGGKSICYQVPALIFSGLTVVISPLIALMQDQVTALRENGVPAAYLNSALDADEWEETAAEVANGNIKMLYLAPESLSTRRVQKILYSSNVKIDCITVDEAHCISEWGHDFRPDYMQIVSFREKFPNTVFLALTATATERVRNDIITNLKMKNAAVFISSFNRPNIYLEVLQKQDAFKQTLECLRLHRGECCIIYCLSRMTVEAVARKLVIAGYSALAYHAGLPQKERARRQEQFVKGHILIMVATIAFGMGINVPNVRLVVHYNLPKSIEQYYQELGRAGRDGLPSHAVLLYSLSDAAKIRRFFNESNNRAQSERLLKAMICYAANRTCRRHALLSYFGEENTPAINTGMSCCDICSANSRALSFARYGDFDTFLLLRNKTLKSAVSAPHTLCQTLSGGCDTSNVDSVEVSDVTIPAQKFLSCILRTGSLFNAAYIIKVLLGLKDKRILENGHNTLSTYGIGQEMKRKEWSALVDCMKDAGLIKQTGNNKRLSVTEKGLTVLRNREKILLPFKFSTVHSAFPNTAIEGDNKASQNLFDKLKDWRRETAKEKNVPPYIIFGDKTLQEIAKTKPRTMQELLRVYGIGEIKADKFGDTLLRLVSETV